MGSNPVRVDNQLKWLITNKLSLHSQKKWLIDDNESWSRLYLVAPVPPKSEDYEGTRLDFALSDY